MAVSASYIATEDDIKVYTSCDSHTLAVALHRRFGWKMLVVTDARDPFWTDPVDDDNVIPAVVHVYALDESGDAWDVRGKRSRTSVRDDMYELFNVQDFEENECADEDALAFYVGEWSETGEPVVRPLSSYSEQDILEAESVIVRIFPNMPLVLIGQEASQSPVSR